MSIQCELSKKSCVPCRGGIPPLKGCELKHLLEKLGAGWRIIAEHHLEKTFPFPNFASGLAFVNKIGMLAEEEAHHPDIQLNYSAVTISIWTHKIEGLSESDFILAAKIDCL